MRGKTHECAMQTTHGHRRGERGRRARVVILLVSLIADALKTASWDSTFRCNRAPLILCLIYALPLSFTAHSTLPWLHTRCQRSRHLWWLWNSREIINNSRACDDPHLWESLNCSRNFSPASRPLQTLVRDDFEVNLHKLVVRAEI